MKTRSRLVPVATAAFAMLAPAAAWADSTSQPSATAAPTGGTATGQSATGQSGTGLPAISQTSPLATQPLPTEGPGQAAVGAAVKGSAPGPAQMPAATDNSMNQQGVVLKPGEQADDMKAAAGAVSQPLQEPRQPPDATPKQPN